MPFGPADPGDPPPVQWYGSLERHDCATLHDSLGPDAPALWVGLAAVCAAAIEGDGSQWTVAEQAVAGAAASPGGGCLDGPALDLLERAVEWHRLNPGRQPAITFPAAGSGTACAFDITQVRLVSETDGVLQSGPAQGPLAGGTLIAVVGHGIDDPSGVMVGSVAGVLDPNAFVDTNGLADDEKVVAVRTPPATQPGTVDVRVTNRAGEVVATQAFTYTG